MRNLRLGIGLGFDGSRGFLTRFFNPLLSSLTPAKGADVTFTRNSTQYATDYAGVLTPVTANIPAFEGARLSYDLNEGATLGPELLSVAQQQMDSGWTAVGESTVSSGVGRVYSSGGAYSAILISGIKTIGKRYRRTYTIVSNTGGTLSSGASVVLPSTTGTHMQDFVATVTGLEFKRTEVATDTYIDNISLREVIPVWKTTTTEGAPITGILGYLSEPASTNLCLQSQTFAVAPWTQTGITISANTIAAPDGTTTADTLTATQADATLVQTPTATTAIPKNWALYIKRKTGTGAVSMSLDGGSTYTAKTITTEWARYDITQTIAAHSLVLKLATSGDAVYVWQSDLTAASYPSSPIVTTTATATRQPTVASYPTTNIPAAGPWAVKLAFTPKMAGSASTAVRTLWSSYKDASNWISLNYNGVILYAEINKAGVKEYVTKPLTTVAGSTYNVVLKQDGGRFYVYAQAAKGVNGLGSELITQPLDMTAWTTSNATVLSPTSFSVSATAGYIRAPTTNPPPTGKLLIANQIGSATIGDYKTSTSDGLTIRVGNGTTTYIADGSRPLLLLGLTSGTTVTMTSLSAKEVYNSTTATPYQLGTTFELGSFNGSQQAQANFSNLTIYGNLGDSRAIALATP